MGSVIQPGAAEHLKAAQPAPHRRIPRWMLWVAGALLLVLIAVGIAAEYVARNAEPILRRRVIATLEDRFRSPVDLDELHISVVQGLEVSGSGLRVLNFNGGDQPAGNQSPMLIVHSFSFRTGFRQIMAPTMHINLLRIQGMRLDIPPRQQRKPSAPRGARARFLDHPAGFEIGRIVCADVMLIIETNKPGKQPLVYAIQDVTLHDVGEGRPLPFEASLLIPKPVGDIHSTGHFGPWQTDDPRETPVDGSYSFTHADLGTLKGISGMLASTGNYSGTLGEIGVTGVTDTPDFALNVSQHPVDLKTRFDATVDGTTGDTVLNSVHATFLSTVLDVKGSVLRAAQPGAGHFIRINVTSDHARIEDLLTLAAKTTPPQMRGAMKLTGQVQIPPGRESLAQKLRVQGTFAIAGVVFSSPKWQQNVDALSARASGDPKEAGGPDPARVTSQMNGRFSLAAGMLSVPLLHYELPGAEVDLAGKYGVDGRDLDFSGTVRTQATASQMLTGWKSIVAMPFDMLLKKNGAGLQAPIRVSGTTSDPKVQLDVHKLTGEMFLRHKDQPDTSPQSQSLPQPQGPSQNSR